MIFPGKPAWCVRNNKNLVVFLKKDCISLWFKLLSATTCKMKIKTKEKSVATLLCIFELERVHVFNTSCILTVIPQAEHKRECVTI